MDSDLRNRKPASDDPDGSSADAAGLSTANKYHHPSSSASYAHGDNEDLRKDTPDPVADIDNAAKRPRALSDELIAFPSGHKLTAAQKENLAKESEETAYGKTPNGTSTYYIGGSLKLHFLWRLIRCFLGELAQ